MKKFIIIAAAALLLSGCQKRQEIPADVIRIGVSPVPHAEIVRQVVEDAKEAGYTLEIIEFDDYIQPNTALANGELDANYFQHLAYLDAYNNRYDNHLTMVFGVHLEPLGLYSSKVNSISDLALKQNIKVAIPADSSNNARALKLLASAGLLKFTDESVAEPTIFDIAADSGLAIVHSAQLVETEAAQLPHTLADVDAAVINGNYALAAGMDPLNEALVLEGDEATQYINGVAVRNDAEDNAKTRLLHELLQSDKVRNFIYERFQGAVVPAFVEF
jgi:D-methionine transport system substrate-binding protein